MKRTLLDPRTFDDIVNRLRRITPDTPRRWGRMNAHQLVCHLADSYRLPLGEKQVAPLEKQANRLIKWYALYVPIPWPKSFEAPPEANQEIGGTRPTNFADDLSNAEALLRRFVAAGCNTTVEHPFFGDASANEWARWAFLHTDHHLRQFGL